MEQMYFELQKEKPFILYGLGTWGRKLLYIMEQQGYNNFYLVDRRAHDIAEYENHKVYLPEAMAVQEWKEYPVLVGIHDSYQQDEVIKYLLEEGYHKFIAIPMDMGGSAYKKEIRKIYNAILDGKLGEIGKIPYFSAGRSERKEVIEWNNEYVHIWIPGFFLFSITKKRAIEECQDDFYDKSDDELKAYVDICMYDHACYRLFLCFAEGKNEVEHVGYQYIANKHTRFNDMKVQKEFYKERKNLYNFYCRELEDGISYFVDNPLDVALNESRNRFNVQEGHHRISFLLAKGYARIPVRMTRKEFELIHKKAAAIDAWCKNNRYPNILGNDFAIIIKYRDMLSFLYRCVKGNWRDWDFLIYGDAFLAQHLQKEKANVTLISEDAEVSSINETLNIHNMRIINPKKVTELEGCFDFVIIQSERIDLRKDGLLNGIGKMNIKYLVWFSGDAAEQEKQKIEECIGYDMQYHFERYFFEDGNEYEWGVYSIGD